MLAVLLASVVGFAQHTGGSFGGSSWGSGSSSSSSSGHSSSSGGGSSGHGASGELLWLMLRLVIWSFSVSPILGCGVLAVCVGFLWFMYRLK